MEDKNLNVGLQTTYYNITKTSKKILN